MSPKNQQPKKRRRKDLAKGHVGDNDGHSPSKPVKVGKKAGKPVPVVSGSSHPSHGVALQNVSHEGEKFLNQLNASERPITKKAADTQSMLEQSPSVSLRGDSAQEKDFDQQKIGVIQSKNLDGSEISGNSTQRHDKSSYAQERSVVGRPVNVSDGVDQSVQRRDEKFNVSGEGKNSVQTMVSCLLPTLVSFFAICQMFDNVNHYAMVFIYRFLSTCNGNDCLRTLQKESLFLGHHSR